MRLTIGTVVYDDYDGLYFTLQAIRLYHPEVLPDLEFIVVDNNPWSPAGRATEDLVTRWVKQPARYVPFTAWRGTAVRDLIFQHAATEAVLCLDCHVLLVPGSLRRLLDFICAGQDEGNLLQGPLVYDDLENVSTHMAPVWRDRMWGTWATDPLGCTVTNPPFEVPMQGLGVFACRRWAWPGLNPHFRGFGGEEGYIHEKFRLAGRRTLCLPFLRWVHRFKRPRGVPYPLCQEDRVINYYLGHVELGLDPAAVTAHFRQYYKEDDLARMLAFARAQLAKR